MQLSQSVVYALHAAIQLAEAGEGALLTRGYLAAHGGMPQRFLLGILRNLVKRGVLRSTRGGGGGFALARRPEEISLLAIVEAVQGPIDVHLPLESDLPQTSREFLRTILEEITEECRQRLAAVALDRLVPAFPSAADNHTV
jgi:Rrf2 family protein